MISLQGTAFPMNSRPEILGEYFKHRHNPSRGNSVALPEFGEEVALWWSGMQPEGRYKDEASLEDKDFCFVLAGGKKGLFLFILCLAWWDKAYAWHVEGMKVERREAAQASGEENTNLDIGNLPDHDYSWFNILNDLIYVLERAQGSPISAQEISKIKEAAPKTRKRAAKASDSPRKKRK